MPYVVLWYSPYSGSVSVMPPTGGGGPSGPGGAGGSGGSVVDPSVQSSVPQHSLSPSAAFRYNTVSQHRSLPFGSYTVFPQQSNPREPSPLKILVSQHMSLERSIKCPPHT